MDNLINLSNPKQSMSPLILDYMFDIRNKELQKNPYFFRKQIIKIGILLASEILTYVGDDPIIINILRAANPLVQGVLEIFKSSYVAFFGVSRDENTLVSKIYYEKNHDYNNKTIIIPDVMLATGASMEVVISRILETGEPKKIIVLSCISHMDGIKRINKLHHHIQFIVGTIDPTLDGNGYIVPGLGDAGDLCYGETG